MQVSRRRFTLGLAGSAALGPALAGAASGPHPPADEALWGGLRREFLIPEDEVFGNTATLGAVPRRVLSAVNESFAELQRTLAHWDYRPGGRDWFTGYQPFEDVRAPLATLLGCTVDELALTQNATFGMNFVANGLELEPGDEILQTDQEHPGGRCGFELRAKRHGAVWRSVALPRPPNDPQAIVDLFAAAITPKTRVLAIPHQTSMLGLVLPVEEIVALARRQGHPRLFVALDGAQSVGQIDVDVKRADADAYFLSPHKWLLAPPGCGALYVRRERQKELWTTLASTEWASQDKGAYRFMQSGTGNRSLWEGLKAAAEWRLELGQERVSQRVRFLGERLRAGLQAIPGVEILSSVHPRLAAGITTYRIGRLTGPEIMDAFWKHRYRVRSMGDALGVRHSLHIYNSAADVDRGLEIVRELARA
jgi:selenocysteine lyase/cysteine desulfurase